MSKKKVRRKSEKNGVMKFWYVFAMLFLTIIYIVGQYVLKYEWVTEVFATLSLIVTAVAFWLEYHENKLLNEAQFIIDLNEQFISNEKMSIVERDLELFYYLHLNGNLDDVDCRKLKEKYDIENEERQWLINYLVHLEGIAALVKNKVLKIKTIDDLMSYRYFLAMNNPIVQELELNKYKEFYKGCYEIYHQWSKEMRRQGVDIPLHSDYPLIEDNK